MNLISEIHNFCERREYTFNVLPEYNIITRRWRDGLGSPRLTKRSPPIRMGKTILVRNKIKARKIF